MGLFQGIISSFHILSIKSSVKSSIVKALKYIFKDSSGNMGLTLMGNERLPIKLLSDVKIVKIASGADHLVLLSDDGHVYTCGCAEQGQLGRVSARTAGRNSRRYGIGTLLSPGLIECKIKQFSDIWAGTYCTFAKEFPTGNIYAFGLNNYYQIGKERRKCSRYSDLL